MYRSILITMALCLTATAAVPPMISYQGRLTDPSGNPVADNNYQITFSVYNVPSGGTAMWTSGAQSVAVEGGLFNYRLGSSSAIPDSIFAKYTEVYLGIKVGADAEITPRSQLVSVGYAYQSLRGDSAKYATTVADNAITSSKIADGAIQFSDIGQNGAASGQIPKWNGTAWAPAADESGAAGENYWSLIDSVIYTRNLLGIARGGATNKLWGQWVYSHVNLGVSCTTGVSTANVHGATIGGGASNMAYSYATVGGGSSNRASGVHSTVPGGWYNEAGGRSSLAAGFRAKAIHGGTFVWGDSTYSDFASTAANQFLIRASGGVGIGTNSPSEQLDVNGKLHMRDNIKLNGNWLSNDGGDEGVWVATDGKVGLNMSAPEVPLHIYGGSDATLTGGGYITIASTGGRNMVFDDNEIMVRNNGGTAPLVLNSGSGDVQLCPTGSGNVGIGTSSPTQKLHVAGNICYTGTIGACSDERYKKDVETIGNALETILKLRGVTYNWKQDEFPDMKFDDQKHLGFLAQDLKDLLPGVVMVDANGYMSVDYSRLTPLLVEAIKELKTKADRIDQLESQLADLKMMIQKLAEK